ncbi:COG1361 family protein [Halorussus amylolyticus]|uniref:hypothetical protein n=1 Tax=Halorussus amylolyticus TaxID=1126242 RepID=UPI0010438F73|nr:hypothetical protein [Halorussus amylolyticus]
MQRRSATVYAVLFLVVAGGAYSLIGAAQQPDISVDGQSYSENQTLTVNDREYTVSSVGDGEGTLTWTNESAIRSATWENNSTLEMEGNTTFRVSIPNESDPDDVTLRQEFELGDNVSTVTENETKYVVVEDGENRTLVPVDEYKSQQFGEPETREYSEGDEVEYEGNQTTISNVTTDAATLTWNDPRTNDVSLAEGENATLGPEEDNRTFVPHFPSEGELVLSTQTNEYQQQLNAQADFDERVQGLWGIIILSIVTVMLLIAFAFLPNK